VDVFLIENSVQIRERLKIIIEDAGAQVVGEAATEEDALKGIRSTQPDLAVIDLRLAE
jgi:DNA-binding NarL/FixJ family response regulator